MHIERMKMLYAMLAGIPTKHLNLIQWRDSNDGMSVSNQRLIRDTREHACGTTACAVGWACAYPPFQVEGLRWSTAEYAPVLLTPYGTSYRWIAVRQFFGLTEKQSDMFSHKRDSEEPWNIPDKQLVLRRIRRALRLAGAITSERNKELIAYEKADSFPMEQP